MHKFDVTATLLLFAVFFIEFILIFINRPTKDQVKDMKANFVIGVCLILVGLFVKGIELSLFSFAYRFALFTPRVSAWLWIAAFFCCDFMHYFYHWLGHKTRLFWTAHVTHHSSEHFNLSTGWRTNFFHLFYRFLFWSPLCFFGFPPFMILFIESVTAIQNFLVHTERVGKLGVLDWIFNTPSNHRVHHGVNPEYIDRNLGGILMIYDHLLGTYAKEKNKPVYGITHNIHSHNPSTIILHEYISTGHALKKIKGFWPKLQYLFSPPG